MTSSPAGETRAPLAAIAAVLGAAVLFGTAGTARELGPDDAVAVSVGAARIAIGTAVLWSVVAVERRVWRRPLVAPGGRHRWSLTLLGGAGVATYTPLFFVAVDRTGVAVGTVVTIASGPLFAGAIEWVVWRRLPSRSWFLGTAITIVGGTATVMSGADETAFDLGGVLAAAAAGFGYALYSITSKLAIDSGMSSTGALAVPFTAGAVAVVLMASTTDLSWLGSAGGLLMALYLGVVATGLAYVLFGRGLSGLRPSTAVTFVLAEPVTAALLAAVVLDEAVGLVGWAGIALVIVGLRVVAGGSATPVEPERIARAVDVP